MTDPPLAVHWLLGCLALNTGPWWQAGWLALFAAGWGFSALSAREQALQGVGL